MSTLRHSSSSIAIALGLFLLGLPLSGLVVQPRVPHQVNSPLSEAVPGYDFAVLDKDHLADLVVEAPSDGRIDLAEWTDRVFLSLSHSDLRRVGLRENWLLWSAGHVYEPISRTQRTERIIAGGAGNCSERCQILKSIVERAGLSCRFIGLQGHVVLEIHTPSGWRVADPDFGVVYPVGLAELQTSEGAKLMRDMLAARGFPTSTIHEYVRLFQSVEDNVTMSVGSPLSPRLMMLESIADWLVWLIPTILLVLGAHSTLSLPIHRVLNRFLNTATYASGVR